MSSGFRLVALQSGHFGPLFDRSDDELAAMRAKRVVVDEKPGFPCRVSLADAEVGETVLLLSYMHHDVASPWRASGPIFMRRGVATAEPAPGEVPPMFRHRLLSLRAYNAGGTMIGADVVQGTELEDAIGRLFADAAASYLHIHNARPGCFNCLVVRA